MTTSVRHTAATALDPVVQIAKAAGDPLRASILQALAHDSFGVLELGDIFTMAQPAISHHLRILNNAGLVTRRKEGTSVFYQRALTHNQPLLRALFEQIDACPVPPAVQSAIEQVYQARRARTVDFFNNNVNALSEQQELICAVEVYRDAVTANLTDLAPAQCRRALEVGPGTGELLAALADRFDDVVGIDHASASLDKTSAKVGHLANLRLLQEDFTALQDHDPFDVIVAAMVVHHFASPNQFFQKARRLLTPAGKLILVDLANHNHEWVKTHCGDLWLGFTPEQLHHWCKQASLNVTSEQTLAQRNGFNVQVLSITHAPNYQARPMTKENL